MLYAAKKTAKDLAVEGQNTLSMTSKAKLPPTPHVMLAVKRILAGGMVCAGQRLSYVLVQRPLLVPKSRAKSKSLDVLLLDKAADPRWVGDLASG